MLNAEWTSSFLPLGSHDGPVTDIGLFPDGHTFATSGEDGVLRVWDADSALLLRQFRLQDKPIYAVGVSPDGRWLAYGAGSRDSPELKPVTIISAHTGEFLGTASRHDTTIRKVRFSPDGPRISFSISSTTGSCSVSAKTERGGDCGMSRPVM
jgi:WD40 repeat protein